MDKTVKVIDCQGVFLSHTYIKRARQLVKNKRAVWVSDQIIRLAVEHYEEEKIMNEQVINDISQNGTAQVTTQVEEKIVKILVEQKQVDDRLMLEQLTQQSEQLHDQLILEKAKQRVAAKSKIIWNIIDTVIIFTLIVTMQVMSHDNTFILTTNKFDIGDLLILFSIFWVTMLIVRICKYFALSNKSLRLDMIINQLLNYLKNRKSNALQAEYDRLKVLDQEHIEKFNQKTE